MKMVVFVLLTLLYLMPLSSQAETITFYSPEIPGLITSHDNGKMVNKAAIDFIHLLATRAGIVDHYEIVPLARAYELTEHNPDTCAMGIGRSQENEAKFKWAGPIVRQKILLYANSNDTRPIHSLEDGRGLIIGVARKSVVAGKLRDSGYVIEEADNEAINFKKLLARHIDLWAVTAIPAMAAIKDAGLPEPRLVTTLGTVDGYIVCNRQVSDVTMERLNNAIRSLAK